MTSTPTPAPREASPAPVLRVLSLGAGVQSTAMALMAAHDELTPKPDCAIFADTGWEPAAVYRHLKWLQSPNVLPFPVHVVSAGNLRRKALSAGYSDVPWYTETGMGRRQCTKVFKLYPIRDKIKELYYQKTEKHGRIPKDAIEVWIGISRDEPARMKPAMVQYMTNRWPLIEHEMRRWDCLQWLKKRDYPEPPRSACNGCPFRSTEDWQALSSDDFADAVEVDRAIRNLRPVLQYRHRSLKPLEEVDFSTPEERGQGNLWGNECEGICGV